MSFMHTVLANQLQAGPRLRAEAEERRRYEQGANMRLLEQMAKRDESEFQRKTQMAEKMGTAAGMLGEQAPQYRDPVMTQYGKSGFASGQAQSAQAAEKYRQQTERDAAKQEAIWGRKEKEQGQKAKLEAELMGKEHQYNLERDREALINALKKDEAGTLNNITERLYQLYFDKELARYKSNLQQKLEKFRIELEAKASGLSPEQYKQLQMKLRIIGTMNANASKLMGAGLTGMLFKGDVAGFNDAQSGAVQDLFNANLALDDLMKQMGMQYPMGQNKPTEPKPQQPQPDGGETSGLSPEDIEAFKNAVAVDVMKGGL